MVDEGREPLTLKNRVVAILPQGSGSEVAASLRRSGAQVKELTYRSAVILPTEQPGFKGALGKAAAAFGDELRIYEAIENALQGGREVILVEGGETNAAETLQKAGAETVWDFRDWTFTKAGGPAPEGPFEPD